MGASPFYIGYASLFGLAWLGCVLGALRARKIDHPDTRRGLVGLLVISSTWALVQGGRLLVPIAEFQVALFILGAILGLASVGAWLYFCSAYTGKSYHRNGTIRRVALGLFLVIATIKITNPIHGQYLSVQSVGESVPSLIVTPTPLHWGIAGLAYVLSAIGLYTLFQLFHETRYETARLTVLAGLAGLPAIATVSGYAGFGPVVQLDYEPIGVAVFALGTLYFTEDTFQAVQHRSRVQILDELEEAVILLDDEGHLQDANIVAREFFPALSGSAHGTHLNTLLPEVAAAIDSSQDAIERTVDGETRYFTVTDETLSLGPHEVGRAIIFTDITELERHRRELSRRENQLDEFARALTHELRNATTIVQGHLSLAERALDNNREETVRQRFDTAESAAERMTRVINDLVTLAQYGGLVSETAQWDLEDLVADAQSDIDAPGLSVSVDRTGTIEGDRPRLVKLFAQALKFAVANDASHIRVNLTDGGFVIEDDGDTVAASMAEDLFEYGTAVPDGQRGGILPTVGTLARVHGWTISVDATYTDGLRYRITDIPTERAETAHS